MYNNKVRLSNDRGNTKEVTQVLNVYSHVVYGKYGTVLF